MSNQLRNYLGRINEVLGFLKDTPKIAQLVGIVAAKEVEAAMGRRIFLKGQATDNSAIGSYSTTPIYVNPKSPILLLLPKFKKRKPSFSPEGKKGDTVFKNGNPHKTKYFADGYAGFRRAAGREPGAKLQAIGGISASGVNLNLTGSMAQNFTTGISGGIVSLGFTNAQELKKARGNEARFGKAIFAASNGEIAIFDNAVNREMQIIIRKILQP
jgi:hypothetical protein